MTGASLAARGRLVENVVAYLFSFFATAECRVHGTSLFQMLSQAAMASSQPEDTGLIMTSLMVNWVCRGIVALT